HFLHGILLREADRFDDALAAFRRVEEIDPDLPRLHGNRGVVHFFLGESDRAVADLETALGRDHRDVTSLFNLAIVHLSTKRFADAQRCLERLIELEPERAGYYYRFLVELGEVQVLMETLSQVHRIKNFLGIVGDRLRRLCDHVADSLEGEAKEDLLAIRDDQERIYSDLVVFLSALRPRPMRLEKVQLRRLVDRIIFVALDSSEGIPVITDIPDDLPEITCDRDKLQEALLNLLLNALEAVRAGRALSEKEEGEVRVKAEALDGAVEIRFHDSGAGMAPGDLERIFQFGFTTKRLGTGIGLAHTRRVVEEHGGRIEASSEEGKGSTLRLTLPLEPQVSEKLVNLALRSRLLVDPRELILEETGEDLGL
ncbi:MAG: sensor histidine kinase, partial [Planctomycetota bacterium]